MTATTELREQAAAALVSLGQSPENAAELASAWADDVLAQVIEAAAVQTAERDELRDRLRADADLRKIVCPPADWKAAYDRFDVARRALKRDVEAMYERALKSASQG